MQKAQLILCSTQIVFRVLHFKIYITGQVVG